MKHLLILLILATVFIPGRSYLLKQFLRPAIADLCVQLEVMKLSSQWMALQHVKL